MLFMFVCQNYFNYLESASSDKATLENDSALPMNLIHPALLEGETFYTGS